MELDSLLLEHSLSLSCLAATFVPFWGFFIPITLPSSPGNMHFFPGSQNSLVVYCCRSLPSEFGDVVPRREPKPHRLCGPEKGYFIVKIHCKDCNSVWYMALIVWFI